MTALVNPQTEVRAHACPRSSRHDSGMDIEDLARLLQNLIRLGTVSAVRHGNPARVRVRTGELETNWLSWLEHRAGKTTDWDPPTVGEQVVLLSPGGDLTGAIVLCGINSDDILPPSNNPDKTVREYPDGARTEYDHGSGKMLITGIKSLDIDASESVTIKTPTITLDADQTTSTGTHTIEGLLSYLAGLSGENGDGGTTSITGNIIHQGGNLESNGIVVHLHVHGGILPGGADTEGPK